VQAEQFDLRGDHRAGEPGAYRVVLTLVGEQHVFAALRVE
jgi:hypothetical protein